MNYYQLLGLERPLGIVGQPAEWGYQDMSHMLPGKARDKGIQMLDILYKGPERQVDPVIIFDRDGRILHAWTEDYIPSYDEVQKVCKGLLKDN